MSHLIAQDLSLAYDGEEVIHRLSLDIPTQQITALIGPNGSGKTTLLRGLARLMVPTRGAVYLDGRAIHTQPTKQVARKLATLPQQGSAPNDLTVRELVAFGRFPYQGILGRRSLEDEAVLETALADAGISHLGDAYLGELSGGQRQLAWIAMALAQSTELLLLDEPTTFLDMAHQIEVLEVLKRLNANQKRTIVMVLHDINQAARYSNHMIALVDGRVAASGAPKSILTTEMLARVFKIEARVLLREDIDAPYCIPLRSLT
ncbi:MAG: iron-enterobactin transporter ATP-binding protein [Pirellulaceae bacterium]|nr:MAG: iron-enterobactin transporter ATP-binding protein [Pirellulaceae bacterium]